MSDTDRPTISDYAREHNITCEIVRDRGSQIQDGWEHHAYVVELTHNGRKIETDWRQGFGIETSPTETPGAILASLVSDAWGIYDGRNGNRPVVIDFEDWATTYGYDTDSRKAERIYDAIREVLTLLIGFLGGLDIFEDLANNYEHE